MVESLLGLLNLKSNDSGWHGSCLSLAELARRGLLLPKRLKVVVDKVLQALVFDERRGNCYLIIYFVSCLFTFENMFVFREITFTKIFVKLIISRKKCLFTFIYRLLQCWSTRP